ncbi:MAG: hypothetical protein QGE96_05460, partial [Candidatus Poseidoniia archaeon]|nr:hypothetical protein [Candidatus Poseidoniia archaeon]
TTSSHAIEFSDRFLPDGGRSIGSSTFNDPVHIEAVSDNILTLAVGDLDGDDDDDLIAGMDVGGVAGGDSKIMIFKNTNQYGTANFNSPVTITLDSSGVDGNILDIASYDIDGDGNDDIVAAAQDDNIIILKSPGGTTDTWSASNWESATSNWQIIDDVDDDPLAIDVGNLAGSSDKDIVVGRDSGSGNELYAYTHPGSDPFTSS